MIVHRATNSRLDISTAAVTKRHFLSLLALITILSLQVVLPQESFGYGSDSGRLLYTSTDFKPNIISRDGSSNISLDSTSLGGPPLFNTWSPDASKVSYTAFSPSGTGDIILANPDGSLAENLTNSADDAEAGGVYSPDGKYLRYIRLSNDPGAQLNSYKTIIRNMQTGLETEAPIYLKPPHSSTEEYRMFYFQPWSPDSERLIVQDLSSEQTDLYVINKDGSNPILVSGGDPAFDNSGFPSITWLNSNELLIRESDNLGNSRVIIYDLIDQDYTVVSTNLPSMPILMNFMPAKDKLYFSAPTIGYNGSFPSYGLFVEGTENIRIYSADYNPTSKTLSNFLDITGEGCPPDNAQCVKHVSPFFSLSDSSVAYIKGYTNISATNKVYLNVYKDEQSQTLKEFISSVNPGSLELAAPALYFNAFETLPTEIINNPENPKDTPSPPKTGKLIGATITSASLLAIVILITKETRDGHYRLGGHK